MNQSSRDYRLSKSRRYFTPIKAKTSRCRFPSILTVDKMVEPGLDDGFINADILPGEIPPKEEAGTTILIK